MLDPAAAGLRFAPGRREARTNCPFCGDKKGHLYGNAQKGVFFCFRCGARGRLSGGAVAPSRAPAPAREQAPDPGRLDRVYRALLGVLGLEDRHREHLLSPARGMTPEQVEAGMYRTLPEGRRAEIGEAVASMVDPSGVPGFWRAAGKWRVAGPAGLVIPVRDAQGRVLGIQVRRDASGEGPRYVWLSSSGRPEGTPARVFCHVARPPGGSSPRVWVTEGPLKADIAAGMLGEPVVAVPGVTTWRSAGLFRALEELGSRQVVVAFDADAEVNPHVEQATRDLGAALRERGYEVYRAFWRFSQGKGLDDLLLGGGAPEIEEFAGGGMWLARVMFAAEVAVPPKFDTVTRKDGTQLLKARLQLIVNDDGRREVLPVTAWDREAKKLREAGLGKGDRLFIEGKLKVRRQEDGSASLEIWVSDFDVLVRASGENGHKPAPAARNGAVELPPPEEVELPW